MSKRRRQYYPYPAGRVPRLTVMIWLSLLVVLLMATVHLPTGHTPLRAISSELQEANPLAYMLMVALCGVVCLFAHRLKQNGHVVRTLILLLDVVGLVTIACTSPTSRLHEATLEIVALLTIVWFVIMAVDYDCHSILLLSAASVILLMLLVFFSIGLAEKGLILYCLICCNLLYYGGLGDTDSAARRMWN